MNKKERTVISKLENACRNAVQYVGMANYTEREFHAVSEIERMFKAFSEGRFDDIDFNDGY